MSLFLLACLILSIIVSIYNAVYLNIVKNAENRVGFGLPRRFELGLQIIFIASVFISFAIFLLLIATEK